MSQSSKCPAFTSMPLNRNKQFFLLSIVLLAVTIAVVMLGVPGMSPTPLMQARKTALHQDHAAACRLAEYAFQQDPTCVECLVIGAEAAEALSDIPRALEFLDHLPQKFDSSELISAWHHKALLQQKAGQLTSAKTTLQKVIRHVPDDAGSQRRMLRLLSDCGYRSESLQYTHKLLQLRQIRLEELVYLAQNGRGTISEQQLQRLHEENPTDEMPINGLLVLSRSQRNASDCRDLIDIAKERLVNSSTSFMAQRLSYELAAGSAESLLGEIAVELTQLHSEDDVPPDAWLVTAEWARLLSDDPLHRRCLAEALRLDPWNRKAVHAMVVSLRQQQSKSLAEFERLSKQLNRIARLAREISLAPDNLEAMHDIVSALVSIGRIDEAKAWGRKAFALDSSNAWAGELVARQQTSDWLHPALNLKLDTRSIRVALVEADTSRQKSVVSQFCFIDEAKSVRLNFEYDNGRLPDQEGLRMHQWTGGGIGVIDIDNDSWPDAYFTQGGDLDSADAKGRGDALFRNLRGSRFTAIQVEAGIWGCDFGQGVSVGDINNDGFDDLYVANVGENRLLLNQGDGTFSVEPFANPSRTWTTSVAIADVDGDNNPDLYDVNYLRGDNVFSQTCDHEGYERICGPADFAAEPDRLWLSNGDGDFTPAADDALPTGEAGRGMGVIVGRLLGESGNQVYVANDESANQLFSLVDGIRFEDVATAVGVGLDHHGQAQGSMGIAAGDTTGRGTADLFVTNYYGESNALYQQFSRSVFVDSTSAAGLASPGYSQLGFGCQLFDADCDGDLDLVVANGHLDDFTHKGHPFRMKPQLFGNDGTGGFRMASSAGAYFETPALGRAVATVDWDGDGRCDLLVGHLDSPAALLTNETPAEKQTATISLIGTRAARTPVGVAVAMVSAGEKQHRWLTAGDGYQCSNEHVVRLAVEQNAESEVGVGWPSNSSDRIERIKPGRWTILEGRGRAYSVPR